MRHSGKYRGSNRPGALGTVLLLVTLLLAGALAAEAVRVAWSHKTASERVLRDYAAIAAWQYARESRLWIGSMMSQALLLVTREIGPAQGNRLPGPEALRRVLAATDCECISAAYSRSIFRILPDSLAPFDVVGDSLSEPTQRELRALALAEPVIEPPADGLVRRRFRRWWVLAPGTPSLARRDDVALMWRFYQPKKGGGERLIAAYGMVVGVAQLQRIFRVALEEREMLPPVLTRVTDPSLMRFTVTGPGRTALFVSGPSVPDHFAGSDTLGQLYGGLEVSASLTPEGSSQLISVVPSPARVGQIVGLLVLTLAVGLGALLLLRRERQLARLRDDFVSGVSHELRTPLTQIRMLSELLIQQGFHTDQEQARATRVIHRESLRLTNLVENVLQFNRQNGAPTPGSTSPPVALREIITEVGEAFEPLLAGRGDSLRVSLHADVAVAADRDAIARILRNLLENAMKYGAAGQTVLLTVDEGDTHARIMVDDEGPGIPPADRDRVWRPYLRLERDQNRSVGGSGLGLAVVAELVASLSGRCSVESAPGGGARFIVELPLSSRNRELTV